jgi:hypothetical protein
MDAWEKALSGVVPRVCGVGDIFLADFLRARFPTGTVLLIHSGTRKESFPTLCESFACVEKQELPNIIGSSFLEQAFADFVLAQESDAFFGNIFSSFSDEVDSARLDAGKRTEFYNPPLEPGRPFTAWIP